MKKKEADLSKEEDRKPCLKSKDGSEAVEQK